VPAADVATTLAAGGLGVWADDTWYALGLYRRLGYAEQAVRVGFIHYNTADEVDRLLDELARLVPASA
jgi:selenocysteine lyase/cysteine desulfurase